MLTEKEVLQLAVDRWGSPEGRKELTRKLGRSISYVSYILNGNRNMPKEMLDELGVKKIIKVEYHELAEEQC